MTSLWQIVIQMELDRRDNDKQIAVVYFTMVCTMLPLTGPELHTHHVSLEFDAVLALRLRPCVRPGWTHPGESHGAPGEDMHDC